MYLKYFITLFVSCAALAHTTPAPEPTSREKLLSLISGEWVTRSIYTAAELDIAGFLMEGPKSVRELAKITQTNEENLYRLLRLLASQGIFQEGENRIFTNTPASEYLAKDHQLSLRTLILFYKEETSKSWNLLSNCIREGRPAFDMVMGKSAEQHFRENPKSAAHFNAAMKEKSKTVIASCIKSYDFNKFKSVYDIGGGTGHFLTALLKANPTLHGTLYELPEVIRDCKTSIVNFERCTLISGDFFERIPEGGDAYLLKSVLHNWTDKAAVKILKKCHEAMKEEARLLIVEPIITSAQKDPAKLMDVFLMVTTGGKERTLQDFKSLLDQAGFFLESITPTDTEYHIIEARKL
ncbi:MAG: methyltransferase [Verrucomicrobia bacterium]|nr:methyltransferase [Verrucomicrobiota bacterium]